jgi:hypothetical protein
MFIHFLCVLYALFKFAPLMELNEDAIYFTYLNVYTTRMAVSY